MMQYRLLSNGLNDLAPGVFAPVPALASLELQVHDCSLLASPSLGLRRDRRTDAVNAPWQLDAFLAVQSRTNRIEHLSAPHHSGSLDLAAVPYRIQSRCESFGAPWAIEVQQFGLSRSRVSGSSCDELDLGCVVSALATQIQPGAIADSSITVTTQARPRSDVSIGESQSDVRIDCEESFGSVFGDHLSVAADLERELSPDTSDLVFGHGAVLPCYERAETSTPGEGVSCRKPEQKEEVAVDERPARDRMEPTEDLRSVDMLSGDLQADVMTQWSAIVAVNSEGQEDPLIANASTLACSHLALDGKQYPEVSCVASAGHPIDVWDLSSVVVAFVSSGNEPGEGGRCEFFAGCESQETMTAHASSVMDCGVNEIQDPRGWSTRTLASESDLARPSSAFTQVIRFHAQMRRDAPVSDADGSRGKIEHSDAFHRPVDVHATAKCHWAGRVDTSGVSVASDATCQELVRSWQIGVNQSSRGSWFQWESSRAEPIQRRARSFRMIVCSRANEDLLASPHGNLASAVEHAALPEFDRKAANAVLMTPLSTRSEDSPQLAALLSDTELMVDSAPAFRLDPDCTLGKIQRSVAMVIPEQPATLPRLIRESFTVVECVPGMAESNPKARKAVTVAKAGATLVESEASMGCSHRWQLELQGGGHLTMATSTVSLYRTSTESWAFGDGVAEKTQANAYSEINSLSSEPIQHVWNVSPTGLPEAASDHVVWAGSSLMNAATRSDAVTRVEAAAQPPRFAAARGVIQIRFAQKVVHQADVAMNQTLVAVGDLSTNVRNWPASNHEPCIAFGGSVPSARTLQRNVCVTDPQVLQVTSRVTIVGIQDSADGEHRLDQAQGEELVAPAFSGNRCTSCFVPQFHNSAAFSSISRERVRRTNRPIMVTAGPLERPAVHATGSFSNLAISMHSAVDAITRRNVLAVQRDPIGTQGAKRRAEEIVEDSSLTERESSNRDRPSVSHALDESLERKLRSNQGTDRNNDRQSRGMKIDFDQSWQMRWAAYEDCDLSAFPPLTAELTPPWRQRSQIDVVVHCELEGMPENAIRMLGDGAAFHAGLNARESVAMHPAENSGQEFTIDRVVIPSMLGEPLEARERRSVLAASFCENRRSESVEMSFDAIHLLGHSSWGIGITQLSDEVRAYAESRSVAVGSRVNLGQRVDQSLGSLVISNLMLTQKLGELDLNRRELAWHAAFFASPLRTALVASHLRSQLVAGEDRLLAAEFEFLETKADVFHAPRFESLHLASEIKLPGVTPATRVHVHAGLGRITKFVGPATFGFSTDVTLDHGKSVDWTCENDVDSAREKSLPVTKPKNAPYDRWNRPRAA